MRQHINSFGIANTVRMLRSYHHGSQTALVENDSDARHISGLIDWRGYSIVPTYNRVNLLGAINILSKEGWTVACTRMGSLGGSSIGLPSTFGSYRSLTGAWEEIKVNARKMADDQICLAIVSADANDTMEQPVDFKGEQVQRSPQGISNKKEWSQWNTKRVALIKKQTRQGLTTEEQEELLGIKAKMSEQLNAAYPLPFETLDWLEERLNDIEHRSK